MRERFLLGFGVGGQFGWIVEAVVDDDRAPRKDRAVLLRVSADGDDVIEGDV